MAIKSPFSRHVGRRAYGYVYTMLAFKDDSAVQIVSDENLGAEQQDRSEKDDFWTRQRWACLQTCQLIADVSKAIPGHWHSICVHSCCQLFTLPLVSSGLQTLMLHKSFLQTCIHILE